MTLDVERVVDGGVKGMASTEAERSLKRRPLVLPAVSNRKSRRAAMAQAVPRIQMSEGGGPDGGLAAMNAALLFSGTSHLCCLLLRAFLEGADYACPA
jgi:hypothetical protein